MLVVVSPAKKLDMAPLCDVASTQPVFQEAAVELAGLARKLSATKLKKMMQISDTLAELNVGRFQKFGSMERKAAAFAFAGDTYQGLEAASLEDDELAWAQDHLRILSGLYGVLRPLDEIEPYRLEMGSRMATPRGKTLYQYWGSQIAEALNHQAEQTGSEVLVNCASQEYFGAVDKTALTLPVITPVFEERQGSEAKIISFFAKRARGAMARFIIQNRIKHARDLKQFDMGGYVFDESSSSNDAMVFLRETVDA